MTDKQYKPLPCPFCNELPGVLPFDPKRAGNTWGQVACGNVACIANFCIEDGEDSAEDNIDYRQIAVDRWNSAINNLKKRK